MPTEILTVSTCHERL